MAVISSGQITIIDMHDAPSLNAWISASLATAQIYDNTTKTWSPNYTSTPQQLDFHLTKAGATDTLLGSDVSNLKWFKTVGSTRTEVTSTVTTDAEHKSGTSNSILKTKSNVPVANNAVKWSVEGTWTDPYTKLPVSFSASIDLTLVQLAKVAVVANMYAPDGDFFRNGTPSSLKINADLYKDGAISAGSRKYKWFIADNAAPNQDSDAGAGWRKVTATSGSTGAFANSGFDVSVTHQGVLTVFPDAVLNGQTFMVVITDGAASATKVKQYITLRDMDDPVMTVVDTTNGNILKNGEGSTTLTARLFRNGVEYDTGTVKEYIYKWYKWQDGKQVTNFGGVGVAHKLGHELVVDHGDVNVKTTFKVEVEKKQ